MCADGNMMTQWELASRRRTHGYMELVAGFSPEVNIPIARLR